MLGFAWAFPTYKTIKCVDATGVLLMGDPGMYSKTIKCLDTAPMFVFPLSYFILHITGLNKKVTSL